MCYKAGQKYGIKPGAPNNQRRIEGGMLSFGGDTLEDTNPLELGLPKRFVDPFGDHEFIGKEALQRISREGVRRKFVGLDFMDDAFRPNDCWGGQHLPIYTIPAMEENGLAALSQHVVQAPQAGVLTVCAPSPLFGRKLGLGYVQTDLAVPGTLVGVQMASGRMVAARVSKLPFIHSDVLGGRARSP
jgi:glycine cleavage system aminomethyltransferase T